MISSKFNLQETVFKLLIFLLPSQLGYHYWLKQSFVYGIRVDYLSLTVYLTDLLVIAFILLSVYEKISSEGFKKYLKSLFGFVRNHIYYFSLFFVFVFVNVFFAQNRVVATFKWIKIIEFILFGYTVSKYNFKNYKKAFLIPAGLSAILISLIAYLQFILQKTTGLFYWLGERSFSSNIPGIALTNIGGRQLMRPYSVFSHPNSLSGFLLVWLILLINKNEKKSFLEKAAIVLSMLSIIISTSLAVYITIPVIILIFIFMNKYKKRHRRLALAIVSVVVFLSLISLFWFRTVPQGLTGNESFVKRVELVKASGELIRRSPLVGVGFNNFIVHLPTTSIRPNVSWWLQPVHNIYLLVLVESGILGLAVFSYLTFKALSISVEKKKYHLAVALTAILLTGLFDHYWLTLQQNQLLFGLVLGLNFNITDHNLT
ncbi:MAG: O-antigen ligase family protein [Candidatus Woesebacteria bacterium]|jgi:O-antigen ligase